MQILIIGDSFGVPNYAPHVDFHHKEHLVHLLEQRGHTVYNVSKTGAGNLRILNRARVYLQGGEIEHQSQRWVGIRLEQQILDRIDLVIWLHTELYRDFQAISLTLDIIRDEETLARHVYPCYRDYFQELGSPVAVIGGCGDLHPVFDEYLQPDFCIPSWRRYLLKDDSLPLVNNAWMQGPRLLERSVNDAETRLRLIENVLEVRKRCDESPLFIDDCHPGREAHKDLVEQLIKKFGV